MIRERFMGIRVSELTALKQTGSLFFNTGSKAIDLCKTKQFGSDGCHDA